MRVTWSHSPHHGGRVDRTGGAGNSAADSRAASTAYAFRTPVVLVPMTEANVCGIQPRSRVASTAAASLARWASVSRQAFPRAAKNSPTRPPATVAAGDVSGGCAAAVL